MALAFCTKQLILTRNNLFKTPKRKCGYIILLPEIGEDLPEKDPLLKENGLPEFNCFSVERASAAVGQQSVLYETGIRKIEQLIQDNSKFDIVQDILNPLEELTVPFETTWGVAKTLYFGNQSLMPTKYYENIHKRMFAAKSLKFISKPIYNACKDALDDKTLNLTTEQRQLLSLIVLEGNLNGLNLSSRKYALCAITTSNLKKMILEFSQKNAISTRVFRTKVRDPNVVADFPEDFLRAIAIDPNNPYQGPWTITLQDNIASQFLKYCPDRELRWNVWRAQVQRGSSWEETSVRTSTNLEDIREARGELANLVGYKTYAQMSMQTRVAGNVKTVYRVMDHLLDVARPVQEREIHDLNEFASDRGFSGVIQQWDIDYWMRKHQRSVLNLKDEVLREYFPLPYVLGGLAQLIENLFDVRIVEGRKTDVWHTDVKLLDVIDLKSDSDKPIGHIYFDPYVRDENKISTKQNAAWMVNIRSKSKISPTTPVAALIFNFSAPTANAPSLLSFDDVQVLFRNVGYALQHVLSDVSYSELAGTSNIEWDAVKVVAYTMTHWLYVPAVIQSISKHYQTEEPLGEDLIKAIQASRKHMAGYKLCNELFYGRLDLELHDSNVFWTKIMEELWEKHFVIPLDRQDSFVTGWAQVFSEDGGANYYSSLWSQIIAADVFSAFEEVPAGDTDQEKEIITRFKDTFLRMGGSVSAAEVFRRFRGRDPNSDALLKNLGLPLKASEALENGK